MTGTGLIHRIADRRGFLRFGHDAMLLSVPVVTIIVGMAAFTIRHNHKSAFAEHQRSMTSMGVVLAEQSARYVQVIDLILREVQSRVVTLGIATPAEFQQRLGTPAVHAYLAAGVKNVPQADAIVLIGADGLTLNSSRAGPVMSIDNTARDFFIYFKTHDDPRTVYRVPIERSWSPANRACSSPGVSVGLMADFLDWSWLSWTSGI